MIRHLYIFDFDGTLFRSPEPPDWWKGSQDDWWHKIISMTPPCLPKYPSNDWWVESTVAEVGFALKEEGNLVILLTGRQASVFTNRIQELLRQKGLTFDELHLSDQADTQVFKTEQIRKLLEDNPGIEQVDLWEDMIDMVPAYRSAVEEAGAEFKLHKVDVEGRKSPCTEDEFITRKIVSRYASSV
jgi:hypothetical protein